MMRSRSFANAPLSVFARLKRLFQCFVVLVVAAIAVDHLEDHVPLLKCVADAVRETEYYDQYRAHVDELDPVAEAKVLGARAWRFVEDPPGLPEQQRAYIAERSRCLRTSLLAEYERLRLAFATAGE